MTNFVRRNLWLAKLALMAGSLLFAFGMGEVFLRLTGKDRPLVWRPDPQLGWWHIPGAREHWRDEGDGWIQINALRMRDVERTVAKQPGTLRVALFGDSMTEGVQVNLDQTFGQRLEHQLQQLTGRRVEVLNFGVNGYSPLQEYLLYKAHGQQFDPDIVLHCIFLDNDVADLHPKLASGQRGAPFLLDSASAALSVDYSAAEESSDSYNREPIATIRRASALYRVMSDARWRRVDAAAFQSARVASKGIPRRYLLYADPIGADWDVAWNRLERVVTAFADDVQRSGAKYVVVSVPAGQIVNVEAWQLLQSQYPEMSALRWDLHAAEKRLAAIAERHAVPVVAPLGDFASDPRRQQLFFGGTGHFTPAGHELMADVLERALRDQQLLPAASSPSVVGTSAQH